MTHPHRAPVWARVLRAFEPQQLAAIVMAAFSLLGLMRTNTQVKANAAESDRQYAQGTSIQAASIADLQAQIDRLRREQGAHRARKRSGAPQDTLEAVPADPPPGILRRAFRWLW